MRALASLARSSCWRGCRCRRSAGNQQYEPLADSVRARLSAHGRRPRRAGPALPLGRRTAQRWLDAMDKRLERRIPDRKQRLELLRTVQYEAMRARLDPQLVLGMIEVESAFRKYAVSRAGARGYMQVMPFWVKLIGAAGAQPVPPAHQSALTAAPSCATTSTSRTATISARSAATTAASASRSTRNLVLVGVARALEVRRADGVIGAPARAPSAPRQLALRLHPARARHGGAGAPARLHRAGAPGLDVRRAPCSCCWSARSTTRSRSASRSPSCSPASGLAGMVHTARNLARIAVSAGRAEPVFAGESAQFRLYLDGRARFDRPAILARHLASGSQLVVDIPAGGVGRGGARRAGRAPRLAAAGARDARDALPARPVPRLELRRARCALPGLSAARALAAAAAQRRGRQRRAALAGARQRRFRRPARLPASDSPRHVAWKAAARSDELLTKQFTGEAAAELWLDWRLLPAGARHRSSACRASPAGCSPPSAPARTTACACPASRSRPGAATRIAPPACRRSRCYEPA